ncbi:MAG: metallophosphoesterase family protein [Desulfobacterales bacterium]
MRLAILSDIHGNLDAFEAVLEDLATRRVDAVYSLGDNIGYGAQPEEVVELLVRRGIPSVLGNHELAALDPSTLDWFNPAARRSLALTLSWLRPDTRAFLAALPRFRSVHGLRLVHGFPPDSPTTYLFEIPWLDFAARFACFPERICLVGHTHLLGLYRLLEGQVREEALSEGEHALDPASRYLVNVGSVGQPRDGDPRAKYVIWDEGRGTLEVRCVSYDAPAAAARILARGLPPEHARRLCR